MKNRLITTISLIMMASLLILTGCGRTNSQPGSGTNEAQITSLEIYDAIQKEYAPAEGFPQAGGDLDHTTMDGAGAYDIEKYKDSFTALSLIPEDQLKYIAGDTANMQHMMNVNSFCSVTFRLTEDADPQTFADSYKTAALSSQWLCGFPDRILVYEIGSHIMTLYGIDDCLADYQSAITKAYPDARLLINAPVQGS